MTYETNPTNDTIYDDMGMNETGRKENTYGIDDDATMSQHGMEIQMPHRAYGKKPEKIAEQEAVGGATVPETLVDDQESRFKITREHGIHEIVNEIDLWVGKVHIVAPTATFWP